MTIVVYFGGALVASMWDEHAFNSMTPAQHLSIAKETVGDKPATIDLALRHLHGIPPNAPGAKEAAQLEQEYLARKTATEKAAAENVAAEQQAKNGREAAITQLGSDLKNLGYNLTVEESDKEGEIAITFSDFSDTDHRVRFLAFIRGRNTPFWSMLDGF